MEEQEQKQPETSQTGTAENKGDMEKHKAIATIGYILPVLFFIPLLSDAKNNPFAKFHANQQLNLLLTAIAINVAGGLIPILGWILPLGSIFVLFLAIMGAIRAYKGEMKKLPLIGEIELIK